MSAAAKIRVGLFLATFAVVMLLGGREQPWGDALVMWEVADSMATRGEFTLGGEWPPMAARGADGRFYAQYPWMTSLVHVPGAWLMRLIDYKSAWASFFWPLLAHLAPALAGAFAVARTHRVLERLGLAGEAALLTAAALAGSTLLLVYARSPYSDVLQAALMVGLADAMLAWRAAPGPRRALALGVWIGLLANTKLILLSGPLLAGALVAVHMRDRLRLLARDAGLALVGAAPFAGLALLYNEHRWGSAWVTGYELNASLMRGSLFDGLWGLFLSPGGSVFLYAPPLVLAALGLPRLLRRTGWDGALVLALAAAPIVLHARYLGWWGGWSWGPRYLVFAVPLLIVPLAAWLEGVLARPRGRARAALLAGFGGVLALGLCVQLLGAAFYWDHWIRISRGAAHAWLGEPDRAGAWLPTRGRDHCDSCYEDSFHRAWLPEFSAIRGHAWMLRHTLAGDDAATAAADAPWTRATTLHVDIAPSWRRVRLDFWPAVWAGGPHQGAGIAVMALFVGLAAGGVVMIRRGLRRHGAEPSR